MYDILQLNEMLVPELKELAETLGVKSYKRLSKQDLIYKILDHQAVMNNGDTKPIGDIITKAAKEKEAPKKPKADSGDKRSRY